MKFQWSLLLALFFALVIAVFAVANVSPVTVNYLIGVREIPLILVIVGSALLGGLIVGMFGIFRQYKLQWKVLKLQKELDQMKIAQEPPAAEKQLVSAPSLVEALDEPKDQQHGENDTKIDVNKTSG